MRVHPGHRTALGEGLAQSQHLARVMLAPRTVETGAFMTREQTKAQRGQATCPKPCIK